MSRKTEILLSARKQFASRGYAGASLRTIAAEAGVSLTLLDHHFGSKARLLAAVDDACSEPGKQRTAALRSVMRQGAGSYTVAQLLETWVHSDFEVAGQLDGDSLLRFFARISLDGDAESKEVIERLDLAAEVLIAGLQGCHPETSRRAAVSAYLFASGASTQFLLNASRVMGGSDARGARGPSREDEARLLTALCAGIEATMAEGVAEPGSSY
jgi:AcrR family transcriptional regulator